MRNEITIAKIIDAKPERVYDAFIDEKDLVNWYRATNDWSTPYAYVDPKVGGKFTIRFEDPKKFNSFDYEGEYTLLERPKKIEYKLGEDREVRIRFEEIEGKTKVTETFTADSGSSAEMQAKGWEAILDNLNNYLKKK